ncbi:MAG TPA: hypothetical protein PKH50_01125 [bacterium]|jgi:hypothetical protein|nr:hypothetical protein [bacterium]
MSKNLLKLQLNILPFVAVFALSAAFPHLPEKKTKELPQSFIGKNTGEGREEKIKSLEEFFQEQKSPLVENADTFVDTADKYNLDYRLLPAIACMESSCGKKIIPNSYNPFGWGIYGKNAIYFKSFDEAIEIVGRELSEKYVEKGLDTPEKIAPVYTPPNPINWRNGVKFFIGRIKTPRIIDRAALFSA